MLRNRIIHQNELVYVGPALESGQSYQRPLCPECTSPITSNLDKLQSISYDFSYQKTQVSILGKSRVIDRPVSSSPLASINLDYLISSFHNENILGLEITPDGMNSKYALISGLADETDRTKDKRNLYLATTTEGIDLIGGASGDIESVLCFHDCQITSYSNSFSVGEIPKASISLEGISASYYSSGTGISVDTVDRQNAVRSSGVPLSIPMTGDPKLKSKTSIFTPANISVEFYDSDGSSLTDTGFAPVVNDKVQSFSMEISMNRRSIDLPDYKMAYDKLLITPVMGSASMSFIEQGSESGTLADLITSNKNYKMITRVKNSSAQDVMIYTFNEVKLDSISHSMSIGDNKSSDISFSFPVDPFDENKSINFSGDY